MDNYFVTESISGIEQKTSFRGTVKQRIIQLVDAGLKVINPGYTVVGPPNPMVDMTTIEQRINYFHLLDSVVANHTPGDVVELGCFTGQCALLFQQVLQMHQSSKTLHLYDSFEVKFKVAGEVEEELRNNFRQAGLRLPVLHKGYFEDTLPAQLPAEIAFLHIDCGFGGDPAAHKQTLMHCLNAVYPRMAPGAVCVLMDYYDSAIRPVFNGALNPGVKLACDDFFASRPEKIVSLYGNHYAHGFFRKV